MNPTAGYTLLAVATIIAALNFYFAYVRWPLYQWLGKVCPNQSGIPMIGNIAMAMGLALVQRTPLVWTWAVVLVLLDTGGICWFLLIITWDSLRTRWRGE